jgi:signal transduction histidine kinase
VTFIPAIRDKYHFIEVSIHCKVSMGNCTHPLIEMTSVASTLTICQEHTRLPGDVETILFRVCQEALTNVARHAQPTHAWIELMHDHSCAILQIQDDDLGSLLQVCGSRG